MGWILWFIQAGVWAIGIAFLLALIPALCQLFSAFRAGFRGEPEVQHRLTPKQEELNRRAMIKRKANANGELQAIWTQQFRNLQMQAKKPTLEPQQDKEKET